MSPQREAAAAAAASGPRRRTLPGCLRKAGTIVRTKVKKSVSFTMVTADGSMVLESDLSQSPILSQPVADTKAAEVPESDLSESDKSQSPIVPRQTLAQEPRIVSPICVDGYRFDRRTCTFHWCAPYKFEP